MSTLELSPREVDIARFTARDGEGAGMTLPTPYYEVDGITLYQGDCREILPLLEAGSVDLVLTDPPYGVSLAGVYNANHHGFRGRRNFDFFGRDDTRENSIDLATAALTSAELLLAAHGSVYCWCGHEQFGPLNALFRGKGYKTRPLVWVKPYPAPPPPGAGWPSAAEFCLYAFRPGRRWMHKGVNPPPSNVFTVDSLRNGQVKYDHPTQKPIGVILPLAEASSQPGDLILDPFAGSGTTLVVAKLTGRRAIGIEIKQKYCDIIVERLRQNVLPLPLDPAQLAIEQAATQTQWGW